MRINVASYPTAGEGVLLIRYSSDASTPQMRENGEKALMIRHDGVVRFRYAEL
jgi:hypothetical protein